MPEELKLDNLSSQFTDNGFEEEKWDDQELEEIEEILVPDRDIPSFIQAIWRILKGGVTITFAYPYTWGLLAYSSMIKLAAPPGEETKYSAAGTLFPTVYDACIAPEAGFCYPIMPLGAPLFEDSKDESKAKISTLPRNAFISALPFTVLSSTFLYFSKDILNLEFLGQDKTIVSLSAEFLRPGASMVALFMLRGAIEKTLYLGKKKLFVAAVSIPVFLFSLFISYGLGAGASFDLDLFSLSFPKMGIKGFFWGALIENILTTLFCAAGLRWMNKFKDFNFFSSFLNLKNFRQSFDLFKFGLIIALLILIEWATSVGYGLAAGHISVDALAAYTQGVRIPNLLGAILAFAFGEATTLEIGPYQSENPKKIHDYHPVQARYAHAGAAASSLIPLGIAITATIKPDTFLFLSEGISDSARSSALQIIPREAWNMVAYNVLFNMLFALRSKSHMRPNLTFLLGLLIGLGLAILAICFRATPDVSDVSWSRLIGTMLALFFVGVDWKKQFTEPPQNISMPGGDIPLLERHQSTPRPPSPIRLSSSSDSLLTRISRHLRFSNRNEPSETISLS